MKKLLIITIALSALAGCRGKGNQSGKLAENNPETQSATTEKHEDKGFCITAWHAGRFVAIFPPPNICSPISFPATFPILRERSHQKFNCKMLEKELAAGARLIGWKMAGTVTDDQASYDPLFGYILDKNMIKEDSMVAASNFPGGEVMVEGEIGFVMKEDFRKRCSVDGRAKGRN